MIKDILFFISVLFVVSMGIVLLSTEASHAITANKIMELEESRNDGTTMVGKMKMILIDKNGNQRKRLLKGFRKDKGKDSLRMMFFIKPSDVKDTGFLTYDYYEGKKDDDQWLYLPELRKTKRIASSDKSSAFMGTDFSYADWTNRTLNEWTYTLVKEDLVRNKKVWVIEAKPINNSVIDRYGYTKSVFFVQQDIYMIVRAIHWVVEGKRKKYLDILKVAKIDGIWTDIETHVKTAKNRNILHQTILKRYDIKYNQNLNDDIFTIRRLEKGIKSLR
jgi:hypothetical protein